jgi:hypothetical protein
VAKLPVHIRSLARKYTDACMETLGGWATNEQTDLDIRIRAIAMLLERGWGRPGQDHTFDLGENGTGFEIVVRRIIEEKRIRVIEGTSNGQAHIEGSSENQDQ